MKVKLLNKAYQVFFLAILFFLLFLLPAGQTVQAFNPKIHAKAALLMEPKRGKLFMPAMNMSSFILLA